MPYPWGGGRPSVECADLELVPDNLLLPSLRRKEPSRPQFLLVQKLLSLEKTDNRTPSPPCA